MKFTLVLVAGLSGLAFGAAGTLTSCICRTHTSDKHTDDHVAVSGNLAREGLWSRAVEASPPVVPQDCNLVEEIFCTDVEHNFCFENKCVRRDTLCTKKEKDSCSAMDYERNGDYDVEYGCYKGKCFEEEPEYTTVL